MINLHGGTTVSGASLAPLGMYAAYLLAQSGNFWLAACFLGLVSVYVFIVVSTLCRYCINYRRMKAREGAVA